MIPKILVPVDESPTTKNTIDAIVAQKERFSKELSLVHIISLDHFAYQMIEDIHVDMIKKNSTKAGQLLLEKFSEKLEEEGFKVELMLEFGDPRQAIATIANEQEFQLVVIGRHEGGGQIRDVLFGSVANHLLHNVKCPVLLF